MNPKNFQFSFTTAKTVHEVFDYLLNPRKWWVGLYGETIEGKSQEISDEFSFRAGDGVHYSNQQLTVLEKDKKMTWLVTDSHLSFLKNTREWTGTKIGFEIGRAGSLTKVTFTHDGLVPDIECYGSCSDAWSQYMQNLKADLN